MKNILFLHDTNLALLRGAELTINQLMALGTKRGFRVSHDMLRDFASVKEKIDAADLVVVNSTSRCRFELELLQHIISSETLYVKMEFDYNFCVRRNILCTVDRQYRLCCNTDKFHLYRELFAHSRMNFFQSPKHYESHKEFYGEAVKHHIIMPPTVDVDALQPSAKKDEYTIPFFGDLSFLKGGEAFVDFAIENPDRRFVVYGSNQIQKPIPGNVIFEEPVPNHEVLKILGKTKTFFCQPYWPEPSGRLAAEAFLSGCEIIGNDRIGTFSFDFYPNDIARAKKEIRETPDNFWDAIAVALAVVKPVEKTLGNVLVYKSYGGLGDIFFCLPSLYVLKETAQHVSFAVAPRLVSFFSEYLPGITVVDETEIPVREPEFDLVIELGNYPAFRGYDLPHAIRYATHKKVKQHAIGHYIDAMMKFHPDAQRANVGFPYFRRETDFKNPYYTIHPGAGFQLKVWPAERYAALVEQIHKRYPQLRCKVIQGPDDPELLSHFAEKPDYVELVTGGIGDVGKAMAGAMFHIGNDAGITHVAGAFNVPIVGIYGPTGPGSWGCFSTHNEVVWGKAGNCDLRCNYDVILNCAHRVCLTSTTPEKVLGALYKLLQKAFPDMPKQYLFHPELNADFSDEDCLITAPGKEFLIKFTSAETKSNIEKLLSGHVDSDNEEITQLSHFLQEQDLLFAIPSEFIQP